ncbi:MAG TPA: response regulator transcription factor [Bacteroidetes bacterium]|nr:response regulator transcription factor [Bacteroidota bacterium]
MAISIKCIIVDDDSMTLKIMENFVMQTDGLECVATCSDAIEAANVMNSKEVDLVFLDVEMPQMTGLELIASLQRRPRIVLVTSKEKYAVPAFELDVTDYIVKPVDHARFLKAVNKVAELMKADENVVTNADKLFVKVDSQLLGLKISDILMVEAMADYVRIYTGDKRHTIYSSMKGLMKKLPLDRFMRVHRSYIVNINHIDSVEDNTLVIKNNLVPVGVTYQKILMSRLKTL